MLSFCACDAMSFSSIEFAIHLCEVEQNLARLVRSNLQDLGNYITYYYLPMWEIYYSLIFNLNTDKT